MKNILFDHENIIHLKYYKNNITEEALFKDLYDVKEKFTESYIVLDTSFKKIEALNGNSNSKNNIKIYYRKWSYNNRNFYFHIYVKKKILEKIREQYNFKDENISFVFPLINQNIKKTEFNLNCYMPYSKK